MDTLNFVFTYWLKHKQKCSFSLSQICENSKAHTKMWIHFQVLLHSVDQIPARQKDQHGSRNVEGLNVLQQGLDELKRSFLLIQLSHAHSRFWTVIIATDQVAIRLQTGRNVGDYALQFTRWVSYVCSNIPMTPSVLSSGWLVLSGI